MILSACALLVLLLSIALAVPSLRGVLEPVTDAAPGWLLLAVLFDVVSCFGYVTVVRLVLRRAAGAGVAWAEMAFGLLVPLGGTADLAVGGWAMRAWGIG